jgi:hypothetical protein
VVKEGAIAGAHSRNEAIRNAAFEERMKQEQTVGLRFEGFCIGDDPVRIFKRPIGGVAVRRQQLSETQ